MTTEDPQKIKDFPKHERSKSHTEAVARYGNVHTSHLGTIPDLTSDDVAEERQNNRKILLKILPNIRYLGRDFLYFLGP